MVPSPSMWMKWLMKDVGLGSSFELVFLGFGFLKHGCGAVHFTLRLLHINGIRLLKVVHQHRELVGIHSSKASHNNHRLPFSIFLKAKHTGVQSRHHWCVIGQNAQLAGSTWQDHLRAGHCHAISFWWQDLVGRTKWPLWDVAIGETTCYTWYTSYTCDMFNLLWFSSEKNKNETDIGRNQKKTLQVHNLKSSISKSIPFPIAFSFRRSPGAATFSGSSSSSALLATTLRRCVAGLPTKLSMLRLPSRTRAPKRRKDNTGERAMMKVVKKVEVFRCAKAKIPGPITPWAKKIETKFKHEPWLLYTETEINNAILRSSKNKNKENSATWIK